ncbi:hypothetical protein GLP21_17690 [Photobacterium carnosum]|uniref:Uncharacterized protein n=1 Tax=Photobacterium carnosum TaxID=2023717 RepID=A0A2N4UWD3_9GAMM|nr:MULTISPECIES: hypothetical protein [Photobacterium]MCD9476290.1 hypothetical protein [Photobacterium phosphoreum]MCD9488112.1 hypothetical protein [Photobacterium iliopiscarium]MCD9508066.1 hypothetical protein [Photobacterium phosphoreum]MCD9539195.1 hypothetical protein [Photobacterium carnosum]MCD9542359.1 hypothetical protein [Photobacterium carnosum]
MNTEKKRYLSLTGNSPYSVLKWLQYNKQYQVIEKSIIDDQFLTLVFNDTFRKKIAADIEKANDICTRYRTSLLKVLDVVCEKFPIITISRKGVSSFVITLVVNKSIELTTEALTLEKAFEDARVLNKSYNCAHFADVTYIGSWFYELPINKQLTILYKTIIGDFGENYYSPTMDLLEKKRIEHNIVVGTKSYDYFIDNITGMKVYNPYRLTSEPASRYGRCYLDWYQNVEKEG